ncbi:gamma-glutamylcyclotransferase [Jannaschia seohaensis]|uniref:glutathione-specific gamma-glutamylcyclotransferase n=1 Tax=Jannaschia seohaensis TaxID=475081 RepID=A0A2Y9A1P9_9RHOB|nr:gamma-glutamylcyclotransferase [Jannaschia seohaensis]PWJ22036.1 cation transport protein ChaC [Jannaschia seohaensis]SSA38314.1 cation transport protein ChaC [Jannaschia seohaensis]
MTEPDALWVFGYGSLVWNPGIEVAETRLASLRDFRRRFCMWSIHHRGSEADPGLVLALEPHAGGVCDGLAIRAAAPGAALAELRERELISSAYVEQEVTLFCRDGSSLQSLVYVVDTGHRQYTGELELERQAEIIAHARGGRGPNHEYLTRTAEALHAHGIGDADLDWLVSRVQQMRGDGGG